MWAVLLLFPGVGLTADKAPAEIFQDYLRLKADTMRSGATKADIGRVLAFYTDDIVYEDPKVKVRIEGKDRIRSGMLSHTDEYAGSPAETSISVETSISHHNVVAAVIEEVFWIKGEDGRSKVQRKRLAVAEFRGDKICRLIDYQ